MLNLQRLEDHILKLKIEEQELRVQERLLQQKIKTLREHRQDLEDLKAYTLEDNPEIRDTTND